MNAPRHYQQESDLYRIQDAHMRWMKEAGDCNIVHKGDIRHRVFSGCRRFDISKILHYWEADEGEVIAWVALYPQHEHYDMSLAPHLRHTDFHSQVLDWIEPNLVTLVQETQDKTPIYISCETMYCDPQHQALLESRGYEHKSQDFCVTEQSLDRDIPQPQFPDGFYVRFATVDDLENLADVHNNSFRNQWDAETYGKVFTSPGMEYEFVVVAPDGRFAAFTQIWLDEINHSILFEPVGTHNDFQRRGIGKAMMYHVMHHMKDRHQAQRAYVCHETDNAAAKALYTSVGFKLQHEIHDWQKRITDT